jgi:uncharacterized protein YqhQ
MAYVGGQAVIEGVMMRNKDNIATAVRKEKEIVIKKEKFTSITEKFKILKIPILRGIIFLFEMLILGYKTLAWSAEQQDEDEPLTTTQLAITMIGSFIVVIALFVALPYYLSKIFIKEPTLTFNLLDGVFRVIIFIAYILIIGRMKDIQRVFQYHGAEHKAVNCYEAKEELNIKNAMKHSTEHVRCGTSLLVFVIAISIILFSFIKTPVWYYNVALRILFVPIIGGIGYEILKLSAKNSKNIFWKIIMKPGLWVQSLTAKEPDEQQMEVALVALKEVL